MMSATGPLSPFLDTQGILILDGGLATALEARGHDLRDALWSARLLADDPGAIREVHDAYLDAGADCITTASYQATIGGFCARGLSEDRAVALLQLSVRLALDAREAYWADGQARRGRLRPLVAASIGPYGAFLANGAEYTGDYDLDEAGLYAFHRRRFTILATAGADLLACETIPSRVEARALGRLVEETSGAYAWMAFSCRDEHHLCDGSPFLEVVKEVAGHPGLVAIGVNCTAPRHVASLLEDARRVTSLPLVAYPNSGETYDARRAAWSGAPASDPASAAPLWHRIGARLIGGCCRVGPEEIRRLRERMLPAEQAET